jgi:hypothetical protein
MGGRERKGGRNVCTHTHTHTHTHTQEVREYECNTDEFRAYNTHRMVYVHVYLCVRLSLSVSLPCML